MSTEPGGAADPGEGLHTALDRVLADLPGAPSVSAGAVDPRSLALGLRIGVERPGEARRLLEAIAAGEVAADAGLAAGDGPADDAAGTPPSGDAVPTVSSLLARSAALPLDSLATLGPDVVFGWAGGLAPATVLAIGGAVRDMVDAGAPRDLGRGFGLAWDAGVRLPHRDLDPLLRAFTMLEVVIGGVLSGRDLWAGNEPAPRQGGLGGLLGTWMARGDPGEAAAAAVMERAGGDATRGLVALWNAWMALRYRAVIPDRTFELLVRPWETVVGRLPAASA